MLALVPVRAAGRRVAGLQVGPRRARRRARTGAGRRAAGAPAGDAGAGPGLNRETATTPAMPDAAALPGQRDLDAWRADAARAGQPGREAAVRRSQTRTHDDRRVDRRHARRRRWCRAPRGRAGHREDSTRRGADPGGDRSGCHRRLEPVLRGSRRTGVLDLDRGPARAARPDRSQRVPGGARRRTPPISPRSPPRSRSCSTTSTRRWPAIPRRRVSGSARRSQRRCAGCRCTRPIVVVVDDLHWADSSSMDEFELVTAGAAEHRLLGRRDVPQRRSDIQPRDDEPARATCRRGRAFVASSSRVWRQTSSLNSCARPERRRPTNCCRRWRNAPAATRSSSPRSSGSCRVTPGPRRQGDRARRPVEHQGGDPPPGQPVARRDEPGAARRIGARPRVRHRAAGASSPTSTRRPCSTAWNRRRSPGCWWRAEAGSGRFRFSHGLVREAMYEDMGVARRARMHRRARRGLRSPLRRRPTAPICSRWPSTGTTPCRSPRRRRGSSTRAARRCGRSATSPTIRPRSSCSGRSSSSSMMPAGPERADLELEILDQRSMVLIVTTSYSGRGIATAAARTRELCDEIGDPGPARSCAVAAGHPPHDARRDRRRYRGRERADRTGSQPRTGSRRRRSPGTWDSGILLTQRGSIGEAAGTSTSPSRCATPDSTRRSNGLRHRGAGGVLTGVLVDQHVAAAATRLPPRSKPAAPTRSACATDRRTTRRRSRSGALPSCRCCARDAPETIRRSDEGTDQATTYGYPLAASRVRRDPRLGGRRARRSGVGADEIRVHADGFLDRRTRVYLRHHYLAVHADACLMAGDVETAHRSIDDGLRNVAETGEAWYEAELHRLRGEAFALADPTRPAGGRVDAPSGRGGHRPGLGEPPAPCRVEPRSTHGAGSSCRAGRGDVQPLKHDAVGSSRRRRHRR